MQVYLRAIMYKNALLLMLPDLVFVFFHACGDKVRYVWRYAASVASKYFLEIISPQITKLTLSLLG